MKRIYLIYMVIFCTLTVYGQKKYYIGHFDRIVDSPQYAKYIRTVQKDSANPKWKLLRDYFLSGKLKSEVVVSDWTKNSVYATQQGKYREWYESGQLRKEIYFTNGKLNGKLLTYYENGQLKQHATYTNEKFVDGKCFDQNGAEILYRAYREPAKFPGGNQALNNFISQNLLRPFMQSDVEVDGKFYVILSITEDGLATNLEIEGNNDPQLYSIALRMIKKMPRWQPAFTDWQPQVYNLKIPVSITTSRSNNPHFN